MPILTTMPNVFGGITYEGNTRSAYLNNGRNQLSIRVKRQLNSLDVIDVLTDQFIPRGVPMVIRSDNGPAFIAGIPATSLRKHDPIAAEDINELTFKPDQSIGAGQSMISRKGQFAAFVFVEDGYLEHTWFPTSA